MRRVNSSAWALAAMAMVATALLVQAEEETLFIELEDRSQALPGAVNDNGSMIVGAFNGGDGFYWMPTIAFREGSKRWRARPKPRPPSDENVS
jgi:hypothetical protein